MDKRLEKALEFSNFRMILTTRQENLKTLLNNKLIISHEGGLFKIDQQLITYLWFNQTRSVILIDQNDIPIKINDVKKFYEKVLLQYESALESYYESYQKLNEVRDIRKVIEWDEEKTE